MYGLAQIVRRLKRTHDRDFLTVRAGDRGDGLRLDVGVLYELRLVVRLNNDVGLSKALFNIALLGMNAAAHVVRVVGVDDLLVVDRGFRVAEHGERFILDLDELCRFVRLPLRICRDDGDHIAQEPRHVVGKNILIDK